MQPGVTAILVVHEDALSRTLLQHALEAAGYSVQGVADGAAALATRPAGAMYLQKSDRMS
jgi:CheY-like chemotaxis protein